MKSKLLLAVLSQLYYSVNTHKEHYLKEPFYN
jgi:hypothetical protein